MRIFLGKCDSSVNRSIGQERPKRQLNGQPPSVVLLPRVSGQKQHFPTPFIKGCNQKPLKHAGRTLDKNPCASPLPRLGAPLLCRSNEIPAVWQVHTHFLTAQRRPAALKIIGAMRINGLLLSSPSIDQGPFSVTLSAAHLFCNHLRGLLDTVPVVVFWRLRFR